MKHKNITRYTYEKTNFQGWRFSILRKGSILTLYFSDRKYGSGEAAFDAVLAMKERVLEELQKNPNNPEKVFAKYRNN